jgi:hypothetical protein
MQWLKNVSDVYLVQVFVASYWSAGFGTYLQVSALASHWLEHCANFTPKQGGKQPIQRQPLLGQYKHQANPLLSIYTYIPLVSSRNDKIKQLTFLSQR